MASIDKRGDAWRVRWRDPDGSARSRRAPTKAAAVALRREVEAAAALGRRWEVPEVGGGSVDLAEVIQAFLDDRARVRAPDTLRKYAIAMDVFLRWAAEAFDEVDPSIFTRAMLGEFFDHLTSTGLHGHPRSYATAIKYIHNLQSFWEWVYEDERWADQFGRPRRLELRRPPSSPVFAPTWAEMDAAIAHCSGPQRQLGIVLRFTGLRVQQAMRLRWSDVDLERGVLTIRGELGKSAQERGGRAFPISAHLVEILQTWERASDLLLPSNRHEGPRQRKARARDMGAAWERAGVKPAIWSGRPHHAFRKGVHTELIRARADKDAVDYLVGHSQGIRGTYTDPRAWELVEVVALIPPLETASCEP